jgi:hypothetical protein
MPYSIFDGDKTTYKQHVYDNIKSGHLQGDLPTPPSQGEGFVGIAVSSDPVCSSFPDACPPVTKTADPFREKPPNYPIDYPVADFGVDHDILHTQAHMKNAEDALGDWNF